LYNGGISGKKGNKLLREFANGNIAMLEGPIQFQNIRQLHRLLDVAASDSVVSTKTIL